MNTLEDKLKDLTIRAIENHQTAFSKFKDPDDAQLFLDDLNDEAIADTALDIKIKLLNYLGE